MELKRNYKGLKKYESLLEAICRVEDRELLKEKSWLKFMGVESTASPYKKTNYDNLSDNVWEGCLGVACVISMIEGIIPNLNKIIFI